MKIKVGVIIVIVLFLIGSIAFYFGNLSRIRSGDVVRREGKSADSRRVDKNVSKERSDVDLEVVARDLEIPWGIDFLPGGDLLVTERPGRLVRIGQNNALISIDGVRHIGEGGLLGLVLHPRFEENNYLYLYMTTETEEGITNRVERYRLAGDSLENRKVIIQGIPGAVYHDGGRIAFGPDGKLYITTGDAGDEDEAQNRDSLAGKILRVNDDGSVPEDNPFGTAVYSYGHRNPQGLAWDENGNLWATEHGRSGVFSGFDEINLIEPGNNYGWPVIQGDETRKGMETPKAHSGADTTWAPAGAEFVDGDLLFVGLRGASVYKANIVDEEVQEVSSYLEDEYGRLRTIKEGPGGALYIMTSNRDGRGEVRSGDDKIIKVNDLSVFE